MEIVDFLPKYPNIEKSKYDILNPYKTDFNDTLFHKKEFYELKLDREEPFPKERGMLTKYQKTISRYMSSYTPYDRLLVVHQMGLGKCVLPNTLIEINNCEYEIQDIWNQYQSKITFDQDSGEWSVPYKKIYVDSFNSEKRQIEKKQVLNLYRQFISETVRKITTQSGFSISTTQKHKILTEYGWTNSPKIGENILVYNLKSIQFDKIVSIESFQYGGWVYDLEVELFHNYIANNIITHNTCSAIGAIEQIKSEENSFTGALILAKGEGILDNFIKELVEKCTSGYYIPEGYKNLSDLEKAHRIKKKTAYYKTDTFAKFAKKISKLVNEDITARYSNKIIVIDEVHNLRLQEEQKEESEEIYKQFHRFLHQIKNTKVLFLSGTPMKDNPKEIADVANLFLPLDSQLPTGKEFLEQYMEEKEGVYYLREEKKIELKNYLRGKISFLREPESAIEKKFLGKKTYNGLKHFIVKPNQMSAFQTKYYKRAWETDKLGKKGIYTSSREATLFVYPDGSYGKEGFEKYIRQTKTKKVSEGKEVFTVGSYKMSDELYTILKGRNDAETLENIRKHSSTYAEVIEKILETKGNCFIYSSIVQGSGSILFSLLLELFGFSKSKGKDREPGLRYALLTSQTALPKELNRIKDRFNQKDNIHGDFIKVIIGSKAVSEGFSFKNVIFESINTPHWNYSETAQALARGIRLGSHNDLLEKGITPAVSILQSVSIPSDGTESIDLKLYKTSEDKDISISSILRILMEISFDCALNYMRNYVNGKANSRECYYGSCEFKCDGINMGEVQNGIDEKNLDWSTYQIYYSNPKIPQIRKKIENLFRLSHTIDLTSIINNLKGEFTEEEINNALYILREESQSEEFDYRKFLDIYSRSSVKKISNDIEKIFKKEFEIDFENIKKRLPQYSDFEILTSLQTIINQNLVLQNRYGLPCYLREEKNIYFLAHNLSVRTDYFSEYYNKYPSIKVDTDFSQIKEKIEQIQLPNILEKLCLSENENEFSKMIKILPREIHELLIESSIEAKIKNIEGKILKDLVLNFFNSYIKFIDNCWVSTYLKDDGIIKCYKNGTWEICKDNFKQKIEEYEKNHYESLKQNNPYEMIAKYNPENDAFCLVDFKKEETAEKKVKNVDKDKRVKYSGKVCSSGGWKLQELIEIVVNRLKIDPPSDFKIDETEEELLRNIQQDKNMKDILDNSTDKKDENLFKRILYWSSKPKYGGKTGIKPICDSLKDWFREHNLLEIDNMCGVQGKKKEEKEEWKEEKQFRYDIIIPLNDQERFKSFSKEISKLMKECYQKDKFKPDIDNNIWNFVFSKKKLIAFAMVDVKTNQISNICFTKTYRNQAKAPSIMKKIINQICTLRGETPTLLVDRRDKNEKSLINIYTEFGFKIVKIDERYNFLKIECEK